jgi:hypothetical protein
MREVRRDAMMFLLRPSLFYSLWGVPDLIAAAQPQVVPAMKVLERTPLPAGKRHAYVGIFQEAGGGERDRHRVVDDAILVRGQHEENRACPDLCHPDARSLQQLLPSSRTTRIG